MKIVKPKVKPLTKINGDKIIKHIELVARTCYKSQNLITKDNTSAIRLLKTLNTKDHSAIFEHYSITMNYVSNLAAYKDLTRHRPASYAIESTRFCNYSNDKFDNNIKFLQPIEIKPNTPEYELWLKTMKIIEENYLKMAKLGCKPDQLSLLLPQSVAAEFNITANLREWNHIFNLRAVGHSRPCIKQIMQPTLELFHKNIPVIFDAVYEKMLEEKAKSR